MKKTYILISLFAIILSYCLYPLNNMEAKASTISFQDLSGFNMEIEFLEEEGIIQGFTPTTFKPDQDIKRIDAIRMIMRALDVNMDNIQDPNFSDVPPGTSGYKAVAKAKELHIIDGVGNGQFNPAGKLTRAEMAKVVANAFELNGEIANYFLDLNENYWAYPYISAIAYNGITQGYPDQTFRPTKRITREEFSAFLARQLKPMLKTYISDQTSHLNRVIRRAKFNEEMHRWVLGENQKKLYMISAESSTLFIVDSNSLQTIKKITLSGRPKDMARIDDRIYVSIPSNGSLDVIDTGTMSKEKSLDLARKPDQIAVDTVEGQEKVFYTQYTGDSLNQLAVYNVTTGKNTIISERNPNYPKGAGVYDLNTLYAHPILTADRKNNMVYLGETTSSGSTVYGINTKTNDEVTSSKNFQYPFEHIIAYEGSVYFNGKELKGDQLSHELKSFPSNEIMAINEDYMVTQRMVYDRKTYHTASENVINGAGNLTAMDKHNFIYTYGNDDNILEKQQLNLKTNKKILYQTDGKLLEMGDISHAVKDDRQPYIYAISTKHNRLYFINTDTMRIEQEMLTDINPVEITQYKDQLYITHKDSNKVIVTNKNFAGSKATISLYAVHINSVKQGSESQLDHQLLVINPDTYTIKQKIDLKDYEGIGYEAFLHINESEIYTLYQKFDKSSLEQVAKSKSEISFVSNQYVIANGKEAERLLNKDNLNLETYLATDLKHESWINSKTAFYTIQNGNLEKYDHIHSYIKDRKVLFSVPHSSFEWVIDEKRNFIFILPTEYRSYQLKVYNQETNTLLKKIHLGSLNEPKDLFLYKDRLYISLYKKSEIIVMNPNTFEVTNRISAVKPSTLIAFDNHLVYRSERDTGNKTVLYNIKDDSKTILRDAKNTAIDGRVFKFDEFTKNIYIKNTVDNWRENTHYTKLFTFNKNGTLLDHVKLDQYLTDSFWIDKSKLIFSRAVLDKTNHETTVTFDERIKAISEDYAFSKRTIYNKKTGEVTGKIPKHKLRRIVITENETIFGSNNQFFREYQIKDLLFKKE